jgi:hypothetical protein
MNDQVAAVQGKTNGLAITSLVIGILAWVLAIGLACLNWVILPVITVATMGVGGILYVCTLAVGCLSPLGWLIGTFTGYIAKNQIKQSGGEGAGMANAGFITNAIGLGLTILLLCAGVVLGLLGAVDFSTWLNY